MTAAPISALKVIDLCNKAVERIHSLIRESPVHKPPKVRHHDLFPDEEEFFQYESLKNLYKKLNYTLRLKEMCELAKESNTEVIVSLSIEDYTSLSSLAGLSKTYSPENPVDTL